PTPTPAPHSHPMILPLRTTTSPLIPFLPRKLTCPLIGISIVLPSFRQLILRVRTMARSLDTSPQASRPTKHPVASYVLLFGISTRPVIRSCIGTVASLPVRSEER